MLLLTVFLLNAPAYFGQTETLRFQHKKAQHYVGLSSTF